MRPREKGPRLQRRQAAPGRRACHETAKRARYEVLAEALREPVAALNRSIEEGLFAQLVQEGKVSIPMTERYHITEELWFGNGALDDFVAKMGQQYQHFDQYGYKYDAETCQNFNADTQSYVTLKWRKVIIKEGQVELELPLRGRVRVIERRNPKNGRYEIEVCKWMGASFVLAESGKWEVNFTFLDMGDWRNTFCDSEASLEYVKQILTGGYKVDLAELKENKKRPLGPT